MALIREWRGWWERPCGGHGVSNDKATDFFKFSTEIFQLLVLFLGRFGLLRVGFSCCYRCLGGLTNGDGASFAISNSWGKIMGEILPCQSMRQNHGWNSKMPQLSVFVPLEVQGGIATWWSWGRIMGEKAGCLSFLSLCHLKFNADCLRREITPLSVANYSHIFIATNIQPKSLIKNLR